MKLPEIVTVPKIPLNVDDATMNVSKFMFHWFFDVFSHAHDRNALPAYAEHWKLILSKHLPVCLFLLSSFFSRFLFMFVFYLVFFFYRLVLGFVID